MTKTAILEFNGNKYECPIIVGSENEAAIDIEKLRALTGAITLDPGYKNSGSCKSDITFLDGEEVSVTVGMPSKIWQTKQTFLK